MRREIVIAGSGGQGVRKLGEILAKTLNGRGFFVSLKSSYGTEVRGGNSFSQVVIKESLEDWPEVLMPDILIAMTQEGYDTWISMTSVGSEVFFDTGMIKTVSLPYIRQYQIPAAKMANELGSQIVANMVMLGAVIAVTKLFSLEDLFVLIKKESGRFTDINLRATEEGYKLGSILRN